MAEQDFYAQPQNYRDRVHLPLGHRPARGRQKESSSVTATTWISYGVPSKRSWAIGPPTGHEKTIKA